MIKEIKKHQLAYLILSTGLVIGVVLFLGSWPDRRLQRLVSIGIAIFYFIWGVLTHLKEDRITKKIIMEYFGIGLLAGILLVLVTL